MEELNLEGLNKLIDLYLVFGIFALVASIMVIIYLIIKLLQWSDSYFENEFRKKDKE